jgi:DNA-binding NarL/FixJ family response regulator
MNEVRIILADNQYLTRLGLKCLLSDQDSIDIIGEAENELTLLDLIKTQIPDLVILDYFQEDSFSVNTIQKIKTFSSEIKVLVITADNNRHRIYNVIENGINGLLTKTCEKKEILTAVESIMEGQRSFCNKILELILERSFAKPGDECAPTPLSAREIEVVKLISKGLIAKEIASTLNLSTHTVYTHRKNIMKKLKLGSSSELVLYAVNSGILQ